MYKISTIILGTITVLTLAGSQAQVYNTTSNPNCTGAYYEDINAVFVDCFDMDGLVSRIEHFYPSPLEKRCNTTNFNEFLVELNRTPLLGPVNVTICSFFVIGTGYQFSEVGAGIGWLVINDRVGGVWDLFYKNLTQQPGILDWDWTQLASRIQDYAHEHLLCNSSSNTSGSINEGEIWPKLNIPWAVWNMTAQ